MTESARSLAWPAESCSPPRGLLALVAIFVVPWLVLMTAMALFARDLVALLYCAGWVIGFVGGTAAVGGLSLGMVLGRPVARAVATLVLAVGCFHHSVSALSFWLLVLVLVDVAWARRRARGNTGKARAVVAS